MKAAYIEKVGPPEVIQVGDLPVHEPGPGEVRVAVAADFASPYANAGEGRLNYINTDVTLYLHRLPTTAWIGFEVVNHHATDGVAIGECWVYDELGAIGTATVAALAREGKVLST